MTSDRPTTHNHLQRGVFDPDHCWACAANTGLLSHYRRVQWHEEALRDTAHAAHVARRHARRSLRVSGVATMLVAMDLLTRL
jgi:hypothetical protein